MKVATGRTNPASHRAIFSRRRISIGFALSQSSANCSRFRQVERNSDSLPALAAAQIGLAAKKGARVPCPFGKIWISRRRRLQFVRLARELAQCLWLIGVGEVWPECLLDVGERADLHHRRLRLFQHQFFVDGANFGLFFERLCGARRSLPQRNVMLEVTNTRASLASMTSECSKLWQINGLASRRFLFCRDSVPLGDGRVLVHVFNDLRQPTPVCTRRT